MPCFQSVSMRWIAFKGVQTFFVNVCAGAWALLGVDVRLHAPARTFSKKIQHSFECKSPHTNTLKASHPTQTCKGIFNFILIYTNFIFFSQLIPHSFATAYVNMFFEIGVTLLCCKSLNITVSYLILLHSLAWLGLATNLWAKGSTIGNMPHCMH